MHSAAPASADRGRRRVREFDFRRPNKLNRDHLRNLQIVHETFARQLSTILSSTLRAVSQVNVRSIDQVSYDEYVRMTPNPSHLTVLSLAPLPGVALLQLPIPTVLTTVDLLLGGHGRAAVKQQRSLTEIEVGLVRTIIDRALAELVYAFETIVRITPSVVQYEANPQFAQIAAPSDMVVVATLGVRVESTEEQATLCFPYAMLQPVLDSFTGHSTRRDHAPSDLAASRQLVAERLQDVPVTLRVQFPAVRLSFDDVVGIRAGDVVMLDVPLDGLLEAHAAGVPVLAVSAARRGKHLACQVVQPLP